MSAYIHKSVYDEKHNSIGLCYHEIAAVQEKQHQFEEAMKNILNALEIYKAAFGDKPHHSPASALDLRGTILLGMGKYEDALEYQIKALYMKKQVFQERHVSMIITYKRVAIAYEKLRQYENAVKHYLLALDILKSLYRESHEDTLELLENLRKVQKIMDNRGK